MTAALGGAVSDLEIDPVTARIEEVREVRLDAPADCPRYCGRIVRGVDPAAATPFWMAERLRRPMSKFFGGKWVGLFGLLGPFFFILTGLMYLVRKLQGKPVWNGKLKG